MLYTFEDLETGDLRSAIATNEAAARLQLGGIWTDVERTTAFEPCDVHGLPAIFREAQAAEEAARQEMTAANPTAEARPRRPKRWRPSQQPKRSTANSRRGARN